MFVKIFAFSNNKDEAKVVYRRFIETTRQYIKEEKIEKIEPYWKFEDSQIIRANIILNCDIGSKQFEEFLSKISDKWEFLGMPIEEALASVNAPGCKYIIDGIEMVNLFYS
jgi:hypothetical protein